MLSPRTLRFDLLSEVLIYCSSDWWEWSAAFYSPVPCLIEGLLRGGHGRTTHDPWSLSCISRTFVGTRYVAWALADIKAPECLRRERDRPFGPALGHCTCAPPRAGRLPTPLPPPATGSQAVKVRPCFCSQSPWCPQNWSHLPPCPSPLTDP